MKQYIILAFIIPILWLSACNKDEEEPPPEPPTNYQPVTKGSYWTYSGYNGGQSYNVEMSGLADSLNGYEYLGFNHTLLGEAWFRKEAGVYFNLYTINGTQYEFPYLKDNEKAGHNWIFEANMAGVNTRFSYTILERDTNKVVFGRFYKDVIVVQMDTYYDLGAGFDSMYVSGKYWYANDLGFIFSDINTEGMTYLEFYEIK